MKKFTDQNFNQEVLKCGKPVLVDFWKPGCAPCDRIKPVIEQIGKELKEAKVGRLNVAVNPGMAKKYGIMGVPTLIIFKDGEAEEKAVGIRPKEVIVKKIKEYI